MTIRIWQQWAWKTLTRYEDELKWTSEERKKVVDSMDDIVACLSDEKLLTNILVKPHYDKCVALVALTKAHHALALYDEPSANDLRAILKELLIVKVDSIPQYRFLVPSIKQRLMSHKGWLEISIETLTMLQQTKGDAWMSIAPKDVIERSLKETSITSRWDDRTLNILKSKNITLTGLTKKNIQQLCKQNKKWVHLLYPHYPQIHQDKLWTPYQVDLFIHLMRDNHKYAIPLFHTLLAQGIIKVRKQDNGKVSLFVRNETYDWNMEHYIQTNALLDEHPFIAFYKTPEFSTYAEVSLANNTWTSIIDLPGLNNIHYEECGLHF